MRKEKLLYILLGVLFVTYVIVEYYEPKPLDWTITFSEKDKNPYGSFILYDRLGDFFKEKDVSLNTLYEAKDSTGNLLIIATDFNPSDADIEAVFNILDQGRTILIAAHVFSESFLQAVNVRLNFHPLATISEDTVSVYLKEAELRIPASFYTASFVLDSSSLWKVHAKAEKPVLISKEYPGSKLILSSLPLIFTNYGMLQNENYIFVEEALNFFPVENISYNRFYQAGKQEPDTPLRYVLSQAPLKWAVYLTLLLLLLFLIIGSRRLQRVIPVWQPLQNTTIQFIKTIGGLYYRKGNHKNAALKIINHFTQVIATKYHIHTYSETSYKALALKSGIPVEEVIQTFDFIQMVKASPRLSEEKLKQLYEKINMFKLHS